MSSKLLFLLLLLPLLCAAQQRNAVRGRVMSGTLGIKDVLVVNFSAQTEARSDSLGYFTIKAITGDIFIAASYNAEEKKVRYTTDMVKNNLFVIEVVLLATELEEIVINKYAGIDAESLGLVPKGQKRYTVWERRQKPKAVIIERKEKLIEDIKAAYSPEEITHVFKIPDENINGFLYYVADSGGLEQAIKNKEAEMIKFILSNMAVTYLKLLKNQ